MTGHAEITEGNSVLVTNEKTILLPGGGTEEENRSGCCSSLWRKYWVCTSALMAYSAAFIIYFPLIQQYVYHRIAIDKFGNASAADSAAADETNPCFANNSNPNFQLQQEAQAETSTMVLYLTLCSAIPATFVSLIFGSYSDQLGRRLLFLVPIAGSLVKNVLVALVIHYQLNVYVLLAGNAVQGLTGSFFVVSLAAYAFIADITPPTRTRTFAYAALEAMFSITGAAAQVSQRETRLCEWCFGGPRGDKELWHKLFIL